MSNRQEAQLSYVSRVFRFVQQIAAIVQADMQHLRHDPSELFTRMLQPLIWLILFGSAMSRVLPFPLSANSYMDYIAPGILAQSVLFVAIFYGIALIWEKDLGIIHKVLVTPAPRVALAAGRGIAAGLRSLAQVFIIYPVSYLLGVHLRLDVEGIAGIAAMVILSGALFSTFSLIVACIVKKRERFMGIGQVMTMPLFFASNALYPIDRMPGWLQTISHVNPMTYQVDALRSLMIVGEASQFGLGVDFGITAAIFSALLALGAYIYPKILY